MPKTKQTEKYSKPKFPPIDMMKACMLERKLTMKLNYEELSRRTGVSASYLRKLIVSDHTKDWPADIRRAVCRELGIGLQETVTITDEHGNQIQIN